MEPEPETETEPETKTEGDGEGSGAGSGSDSDSGADNGSSSGDTWIDTKIRKAMIGTSGHRHVAGFWLAAEGNDRTIYRHLKPGLYTFRVRVIGRGSWDRKAAKRRFQIR